jgi:hypothetical protein
MPNFNNYLFTFFLVFSFLVLNGQEITVTGYIIKDTDTLRGQVIDYKSNRNQFKCSYLDSDGITLKFKPDEIKAWGTIDGKHFRSVTVVENKVSVQRFAQVLVKGYADLLVYYDNDGNERFFIKSNTDKYSEVTDPASPKDSNKTKGRLIFLFANSPELRDKVSKSKFDRDNIIEFTAEYHLLNCENEKCEIFVEKKLKPSFNFGIHAGFSVSSLKFVTTEYHNIDNEYKFSAGPVLGLSGELCLPTIAERFGLRAELLFLSSRYVGDEVTFNMNTMRFPLYAVYHLGNRKSNFEVFGGVFGTYQMNVSQKGAYLENPNYSVVIVSETGVEFSKKALSFGFSGGISYLFHLVKEHKLVLSMRYSKNWNTLNLRYYCLSKK